MGKQRLHTVFNRVFGNIVQYMDILCPRKQTGLIRAFPFVLKHINTVD